MKAVDCQGLAGGFTMGAVQVGFDIVAKYELDNFGTANTERNSHLLGEFPHVLGEENWEVHDVPFVFGSPPCSGFSMMNTAAAMAKKRGTKVRRGRGANSPINDCMWSFATYVAKVKPEIAIFESVQGAGKRDGRVLMRRLRDWVVADTGIQYDLTHVFMNVAMTGGVQARRRYFWVIHRIPFGVSAPKLYVPTIRDAIYDLVGLDANTWETQTLKRPPSEWAKYYVGAGTGVNAHIADSVSTQGRRVRNLASTGLWEPGEKEEEVACLAYDRDGHMPDVYTFDNPYEKTWGFYQTRRLTWDRQMFVMAGNGLHAFVHPEEDRSLTIREGSRLMGYPDAWDWSAAAHVNQAQSWLGKGLVVQAGRWISEQVRNSLEGKPWDIDGQPEPDKDLGSGKYAEYTPLVAGEYVINVTNIWKEWV